MKRNFILFAFILALLMTPVFAQESGLVKLEKDFIIKNIKTKTLKVDYKAVGADKVSTYIYLPKEIRRGQKRPVLIMFHGGGWNTGGALDCQEYCKRFSRMGFVTLTVEYRLVNTEKGITPLECIKDAKSVIRWVRMNAKELGINPKKIIVSGFSAGGHLAAVTGLIEGFEEAGEDLKISSKPNALMLFCPAVDITILNNYFASLFPEPIDEALYSPTQHISKKAPPTIIFHGLKDPVISINIIYDFTDCMNKAGVYCELHTFDAMHDGLMDDITRRTEAYKYADAFFVKYKYTKPGQTEVKPGK